jgi:hypothetical protein
LANLRNGLPGFGCSPNVPFRLYFECPAQKQTTRYQQALHMALRGYQERDGDDHRRDILLGTSRLADKTIYSFW